MGRHAILTTHRAPSVGALWAHVSDGLRTWSVVLVLLFIAVAAMNDQPYAPVETIPPGVRFNPHAELDGSQVRDCRNTPDMDICRDPNYNPGDDINHGA